MTELEKKQEELIKYLGRFIPCEEHIVKRWNELEAEIAALKQGEKAENDDFSDNDTEHAITGN